MTPATPTRGTPEYTAALEQWKRENMTRFAQAAALLGAGWITSDATGHWYRHLRKPQMGTAIQGGWFLCTGSEYLVTVELPPWLDWRDTLMPAAQNIEVTQWHPMSDPPECPAKSTRNLLLFGDLGRHVEDGGVYRDEYDNKRYYDECGDTVNPTHWAERLKGPTQGGE